MNLLFFRPLVSCLILSGIAATLRSEVLRQYEIPTSSTSDGEIADHSKPSDNIPDEVDNMGKAVKVGSYYGAEYAGVFEFPLPPKNAVKGTLKSAILVLYANHKGLVSSTVEVFAYSGKNADGVVSLADWDAGTLVGNLVVEGKSEVSVLNKVPPMDVTQIVNKSLIAQSIFIGFRLRCPDAAYSNDPKHIRGIILRSAEFANDFPRYAPKLILTYAE